MFQCRNLTLATSAMLLFSLVSLTLSGCSRAASDAPAVIPVTGIVTWNGEPLEGAKVQFTPSQGRSSFGRTDASGEFTLIFNEDQKGAIPGEHIVRINAGRSVDGQVDDEGQPLFVEIIPPQYNSQSALKVTVSKDSAPFEFHLKAGG